MLIQIMMYGTTAKTSGKTMYKPSVILEDVKLYNQKIKQHYGRSCCTSRKQMKVSLVNAEKQKETKSVCCYEGKMVEASEV